MKVSNGTTKTSGAFFTPLIWAKWVVKNNGLFDRWLDGALILDPTAGEGNLLEAFIATAIDNGVEIHREMLERLIGIEKEEKFAVNFYSRMKSRYGISFPWKNFRIFHNNIKFCHAASI